MARGNFRTSKSMCLFCGKHASQTKIYKRARIKRQPDYLCEKCFDKNSTEAEMKNKDNMIVN